MRSCVCVLGHVTKVCLLSAVYISHRQNRERASGAVDGCFAGIVHVFSMDGCRTGYGVVSADWNMSDGWWFPGIHPQRRPGWSSPRPNQLCRVNALKDALTVFPAMEKRQEALPHPFHLDADAQLSTEDLWSPLCGGPVAVRRCSKKRHILAKCGRCLDL